MATHPVDEIGPQLQGRLMLVEALLTLLLTERPDYQGVLDNVEGALAGVEAHMLASEPVANRPHMAAMFEAARQATDGMAFQIRHMRGEK